MDIFFYFIISFLKGVSLVQIEDGNLNDIFLNNLLKFFLEFKFLKARLKFYFNVISQLQIVGKFLGLLIMKSLFYKVRVDVNKERCGYCIICFMICLGEQCGLWILY